MLSLLFETSKKIGNYIGFFLLILVVIFFSKLVSFYVQDTQEFSRIGELTLPSSNEYYEYEFHIPSDSNYVLELHRSSKGTKYVPDDVQKKCHEELPIIAFNFKALNEGGVFNKNSQKNRRARVLRESERQACTRKYFTGTVNWNILDDNNKSISHGNLPNVYSHGSSINKLRSDFYYGLSLVKNLKKSSKVTLQFNFPPQEYDKKNKEVYNIFMKKVNN